MHKILFLIPELDFRKLKWAENMHLIIPKFTFKGLKITFHKIEGLKRKKLLIKRSKSNLS